MSTKTKGELLKEELCIQSKNAYELLSEEEVETAYRFCAEYMDFLNRAKTEREAVAESVEILERNGFSSFEYGKAYKAGDKVYFNNRGKAIYLAVIGSEALDKGLNIAAAHIDSPRIDLKQRPLYEDGGMALFKTHYYGGIKKYQWTALPLALHGVIVKKNQETISVSIGENADEPVFCITDLLPHLGKEQMNKTLSAAFTGEALNILVGSRPYVDDKVNDKIKLNILNLLHEKYGVTESDFLSAELTLVPAEKARDLGFDRSMICAYGHDDRVCAYPILMAAIKAAGTVPKRTAVTILADKEEIGSEGNTGMQSFAFENMLVELAVNAKVNPRVMFENSRCLSADVNACFDPNYPDVYEAKNSAYLNQGVAVTKFTGSRGKSETNDASAEFMGEIRSLLDENKVQWQTAELGKVDQGGGGTVAMYLAKLNINVIDIGVPVLSMHAPFEVVSKTDVYMAYRAFEAFFLQ